MSTYEFEQFLLLIKQDYGQLSVIHSIHYWMESEKLEQTDNRRVYATRLLAQYSDMCSQIINDNISLYHGDNYHPKNAWGLYHYYKKIENIEGFTSYIASNLSEQTVYRVLWDITSVAIGNQYSYSITEENFTVFINNVQLVDQLIEQRPPKSEDEEFVLRVYQMFRSGEPDIWGRKGVISPTEQNIQL